MKTTKLDKDDPAVDREVIGNLKPGDQVVRPRHR